MQLFPQATNSAKSYDGSAYNNSQSESAKGYQQLQETGQAIAKIMMALMA